MTSKAQAPAAATPLPRWQLWAGRVMTALPALMLSFSAFMKLSHAPGFVAMWTEKLGYPERVLSAVGIVELLCVALYVVPRTSVLGAVLVSAYLGGAVTSHVRMGDPFFVPILLGVLAWGGLWLRDERVRALLPFRPSA
ncbi:MAG: DoxX family protein [Deltaproteobacteria bacterium]|nr:DoxX family protein [Deltaproteobacteria bacterium]